jgi:uncharacterized lipoprotein YajG
MIRTMALLATAALLTGCVAGQHIKLHYEPAPQASSSGAGAPFVLVVKDQREYVTSGNKTPWYIGHYRAGFGNTWDVVNFNQVPLADQMKSDLHRDLLSLGFVEGASGSAKTVTVTITEWNFDAAINGRLWYDVQVSVAAADGHVLATSQVKDEKVIKGSVMMGAKGAMEDEIPTYYAEVIRKLVRENPTTLGALGS